MSDFDLSSLIKVYENQLSEQTCKDIIARFEASGKDHHRRSMRNIRSFTELNIEHLPDWQETRQMLEVNAHENLIRYREDCVGALPTQYEFEQYRLKRYQPDGGDVFGRHIDCDGGLAVLRFAVLFWYLNDVDEGGETWFPQLKLRVRPRRGRALMFPPYWMYQHAGLRPVSNTKYILGTYFVFPRPRDLVEE